MGLKTLGKQNGGVSVVYSRYDFKATSAQVPRSRRYTKKMRSLTPNFRKKTFSVLLGPNHTQPAKVDFVDVWTQLLKNSFLRTSVRYDFSWPA